MDHHEIKDMECKNGLNNIALGVIEQFFVKSGSCYLDHHKLGMFKKKLIWSMSLSPHCFIDQVT